MDEEKIQNISTFFPNCNWSFSEVKVDTKTIHLTELGKDVG